MGPAVGEDSRTWEQGREGRRFAICVQILSVSCGLLDHRLCPLLELRSALAVCVTGCVCLVCDIIPKRVSVQHKVTYLAVLGLDP